MFENEFKLLVLLTIALLIFGPSKMASIGGTIGKSIREFRNAVRGAQDSFREQMTDLQESYKTVDPTAPDPALPAALPAPDPPASTSFPDTPMPDAASATAAAPAPATAELPDRHAPDDLAEHDERHSLASEPSAQSVQDLIQRKG